jgi:peptide/nickel transport system substrate-binding protein
MGNDRGSGVRIPTRNGGRTTMAWTKGRAVRLGAVIGVAAMVLSACGSSSTATKGANTNQGSSSGGISVPTSGVGLTVATKPSGARQMGGTVTFTEGPEASPNYIFPMTSAQVCSTANLNQLSYLMYRPLYWYGNDYRPTIDYSYSVGQAPVFSDGSKTVTVHLNNWKWSDGEPVSSYDVLFWMQLYKADPATNYCGYVPGYFPDNVTSIATPNASTVVFHLNRSYDPEWFLYNELSQITPIPLAWDRTSLSQPAPTRYSASLPSANPKTAEKVYDFLNTQSKDLATWASSPIWSVVDGPFKLQSFTNTGEVTMVPNPDYSGSPKPTISKFVELPYTSDAAVFNAIRAGGPSQVTIGNLPSTYATEIPSVVAEGYEDNQAASYSINYFPLNLNNPTVGPIFRQLYFRQAFQHLVDQEGWIKAYLHDTAIPTYGPIPTSPPSPLAAATASANPYPFSVADAAALLKAHGWDVKPGGLTTCAKPGTAAGDCGAGIKAGQDISFNLDYQSGVATIQAEMQDLQAQAAKVGIQLNLTNHPFATVIGTAIACQPTASDCKWTAENWGAGWIYGPDYLPTGESLYAPGSVANYGSFSNPQVTALIDKTIYGPVSQEKANLTAFAKAIEEQVPVVFGPTSIGTYQGDAGTMVAKNLGGYAANALGLMNPEDWYLTK